MKECASKFIILKRSAVSWKTKQSTCFQEALRRLLHILPSLPDSERISQLNRCLKMFRISGYSEKERFNFLKGAMDRYDDKIEKV